jgi:acyl-CoA thioesterase YciA
MNVSPTHATQLPTDQELVLKVIPMPADCNANGDIFGGWVMAQVDLAGAVLPARRVKGRMATVAVNQQGVYVKVTEATLTYVAIDDEGRPRSIPPLG